MTHLGGLRLVAGASGCDVPNFIFSFFAVFRACLHCDLLMRMWGLCLLGDGMTVSIVVCPGDCECRLGCWCIGSCVGQKHLVSGEWGLYLLIVMVGGGRGGGDLSLYSLI
jgi:hypothetical protein